MKRIFPMLVVLLAGIVAVGYVRNRTSRAGSHGVIAQPFESDVPRPPQAQRTEAMVTVAGPPANYMNRQASSETETNSPRSSTPHALDHIGASPVGTSSEILHTSFSLQSTAEFPFEIPPHAVSARLRGRYQSYVRGGESGDDANVEFLLMNDKQFQESAGGGSAETVMSADPSHAQTVDFALPATLDRPVKYHLVFRNSPAGAARKTVQADFNVDF
jgi:hypothetical protein